MQDSVAEPSRSAAAALPAPTIYHLVIERFRGIKTLSWHAARGANAILDGGDVGKTTILEAIGLVLSPTNPATLSDTDYHARSVDAGFVIEAVVSLPFWQRHQPSNHALVALGMERSAGGCAQDGRRSRDNRRAGLPPARQGD